MFDPQRLLGQLLTETLGGGFGHRKRRGSGMSFATKAQLGLGALGVAMAAYEHFSKPTATAVSPPVAMPPDPLMRTPAPSLGAATVPPPAPPAAVDLARLSAVEADAVLLVQSMIAAAAADGVIDTSERTRLMQRAEASGLDATTRQFLEAELAVPKSADTIGAMTRPGLTHDVYAAAVLAIDLDSESERRFLTTLGNALGLDEDTRIGIHQQVDARS